MLPNGIRQPMPFPVFINDSADHQYAGNTEYPEKDDIEMKIRRYFHSCGQIVIGGGR